MRRCDVTASEEDLAQAVAASEGIRNICETVNETQKFLENARLVLEVERRYHLKECACSLENLTLLNQNTTSAYRAKRRRNLMGDIRRGEFKIEQCTLLLFNTKLTVVIMRPDATEHLLKSQEKPPTVRRAYDICLRKIESIRHIRAIRTLAVELEPLNRLSGFVVLFANDGNVTEELIVLDDDEISACIWVAELSQAFNRAVGEFDEQQLRPV
jgi:hypothetical protein